MMKLTSKEINKIKMLRSLFPQEIRVYIHRSQDGGFVSEVRNFPGCVTEAETLSELVDMINDAVRTMLEIPKKYVSYMPIYLLPLKVAQRFNVFPVKDVKSNLTLHTHEPTAR